MKPKVITKSCLYKIMVLAYCGILCGCEKSEMESSLFPEIREMNGDPVEVLISLADTPVYGSDAAEVRDGTSRSTQTGDGECLVGEWVKPERFSLTRSGEDNGGPAIASMELFDTPDTTTFSSADTRAVMTAGYYFRVIVFKKSGNSYVYQSAADYTSNGTNVPALKRGSLAVAKGQTYRFVAYSFNNNTDLGNLPASYAWNSTAVSIPNLNNDFMTYDSGDKAVTSTTFALTVNFTQQLCKLTVNISASGFDSNTFTNCTGVRINQGGNSSSWTVGQAGIAANINNTANFNIANNSTATVRIVPFSGARTIGVYFNTLSVGGKSVNGTTVTSSQSVQLLKGKNYTLTVKFKKKMGVQLPESEINLTGNGCTANDKKILSKLIWAEGNLKSTGNSNYVWGAQGDYGYYYTWYSTYGGDGSSNLNNTDPCSKLTESTYGSGWRTPSIDQLEILSKCTDLATATVGGNKGMWFMSKTKGIFLPYAGNRPSPYGSGLSAIDNENKEGFYWSRDTFGGNTIAYILDFLHGRVYDNNTYATKGGLSVRCVKE